jgi:penicillin-insensitive murein endopeptidase
MGMRDVLVLCAAVFAAGGCVAFAPESDGTWTFGQTADGVLVRGVSLPDSGDGFVRARPGEETRFGTPQLVGAITRAAAAVERDVPGGAPLRIGDLSWPGGGRHPRHGSHRSGRDADVIFYVVDASGRSSRGRGWLSFDRSGAARETAAPEGVAPSNELFFFDEARNWHLVRTLLLDPEAAVQWIFCSRGVKARLLEYAAIREPDPRAIFRASWVLHQPSSGNPHSDHFHVRVLCTAEERAAGCWNRGPVWPWLRPERDKPAPEDGADRLDDAALVRALMEEPPAEPG